jgi:peptidoglycan/LPS O-acetylase OafA/YrhL
VPFSLGHRPALDGVRGCAIALVVALHLGIGAKGGFIGVEVFFVLSGFVITAVLLEESRATGRISLPYFYARRALRLLPALAVVLVAVTGYVLLFSDKPATDNFGRDAAAAVFYVANWLYASVGNQAHLLTHTWSLSVEEQFYLVWPLLLAGLLARKASYPVLLAVCLSGAAASVVLRYALFRSGSGVDRVYFGTDTRAGALLLGCAVAVIAYAGWLPTGKQIGNAVSVLAVLGGAGIVAMAFEFTRHRTLLYSVGFAAVAGASALIIAAVLISPDGLLTKALSFGPLQALGRISYGVYLWHWPIHFVVAGATPGSSHVVRASITLVLSLVIPTASFLLIEQPLLRLKKRFTPAGRDAAVPVGT